uniref:RING-type domain-containing protein n=1 Tax=Timema monikensis TaxID=170555 RepID=A0A7R9HKP2_9NEOP|nr:unnamed protein product [Timema monikensis]
MADSLLVGVNGSLENLVEETLNIDIEELDDAEYDIPAVKHTPTLESILNDLEDQTSLSEDEMSNSLVPIGEGVFEGSETLSLGSIDTRSRSSSEHRQTRSHRWTHGSNGTTHLGSILRHVILKGISTQMVSASERVNAGLPTAMAATTMIAVGTSHGLVLVFDAAQVLRWCLGASDQEQGSVSSLSFNHDCSRLLVGFAKGHILMFDITNGKLLRTLTDVHPPGTAVLHVKVSMTGTALEHIKCSAACLCGINTINKDMFRSSKGPAIMLNGSMPECKNLANLALCSDSGGSVFELNFRRMLGVRGCDSKCLFSGSRGEVCCIEPLLLHQLNTHSLRGVVLVAMATLSKTVKGYVSKKFYKVYSAQNIQEEYHWPMKYYQPDMFFFPYQIIVVSIRPRMRVMFTHALQASPASLPLITWQFVVIQTADSSRVVDPVLAFARESTLHFFQVSVDTRSKIRFVPLQKVSVSYLLLSVHWVNTRTLAALDTLEQLHLLDVRTQEELEVLDLGGARLVYTTSHFKGLSTGGNVSKAMALAGERACYNSVVSYGNQLLVLGTKTFHVLTIRAWNERLAYLVKQNKYLDALTLGMAFYLEKGKAVVGLKGPKHKRKETAREKVLEILLSYIDDTLVTGDGSTELYYEAIPVCIEYCIELDVLDILYGKMWDACTQQVSRSCYLESLEPWLLNDRLPNVPPSIMQEFVSYYEKKGSFQALEACLVHLEVMSLDINQVMRLCWAHGMHDAIIHIHNRGMRDYVAPLQELMPILQTALSKGKPLNCDQIALGNKLLVYISCCLAGRAYPAGDIPAQDIQNVKYEVFKCLTCLHSKDASDSESSYPYLRTLLQFDTREFLNVLALAFEEPEFTSELGLRQVQRLVDILLLVMVQGDGFTPSQVGSLFTFLARQLAKPWCSLHVDRQLFEQVVEFLTENSSSSTPQHHEERQQALLELMKAGGLQHYDQNKLLKLADKAAFYRVCELLYEQRREYDKILHCYLQDPLRKPQVFSFLRNLLLLYSNTPKKSKVETQIVDKIVDLLDVDCIKTGHVICLHLPHLVPVIVSKLQAQPNALFQFLKGIFHYRESSSKEEMPVEPQLVEQYIDLMCMYAPESVLGFVSTNEEYRLDHTTTIMKRHGLSEPTAFLLEKAGDFQGALYLLLGSLDHQIEAVVAGDVPTSELGMVTGNLVGLCQRGSPTMDEKERQAIWFQLLESLMKPQRSNETNLPVLKELTQQLLTSMSSYVSLPAMIQFILKDPAYTGGKFGDIRELMMGMLSNSCYEETLLQVTSRLLSTDLHHQLSKLLSSSSKGIAPQTSLCSICHKPLEIIQDLEEVVFFRCGHGFHSGCLEPPLQCCHCSSATNTSNLNSPNKAAHPQQHRPQSISHYKPSSNSISLASYNMNTVTSQELLQSENFTLKLAPPPPPDLEGIF